MLTIQEKYYGDFIAKPSADNALRLVLSFKSYAERIAGKWNDRNLTYTDKIKELICEMFLILLEEFNVKKSGNLNSLMLYLHLKLKKVIYRPQTRDIALNDDCIESIGRMNFTSEKIEYADALFKETRKAMLSEYNPETALLLFLFIHIYPDVQWADQLLNVKFEVLDKKSAYEKNRKRIYRFNNNLRKSLESLKNFNWKEITEWTGGERSHLAWRLIFISPSELHDDALDNLKIVDDWRENFKIAAPYCPKKISAAEAIFKSMQSFGQQTSANHELNEEIDYWSEPPNIIGLLLGGISEPQSALTLQEKTSSSYADSFKTTEKDYEKIAEELTGWFETLLTSRLKKNNNTKIQTRQ